MSASDNPPSESRLSTRISIRWIPEPASETTDTLVMSVAGWYVDLRVDKISGEIDWAIAGERVVDGLDSSKVQFTHDIDSHNSFHVADCGTFSALPNGDDLEVGEMPRPDRPGAPVTAYEEVWRELKFREGPEGAGRGVSWVLESRHEGVEGEIERVFLARIWGSYLAVRQGQVVSSGDGGMIVNEGKGVSARREEWEANGGWTTRYVLGTESLPTMSELVTESTGDWETGGTVTFRDQRYTVRSFELV